MRLYIIYSYYYSTTCNISISCCNSDKLHFQFLEKQCILCWFYLCKELGQLCTCRREKASFVAVVTFKPAVFGGLWLGGNNVASCDVVIFVVGVFTDDFPELCAVAAGRTRLVWGTFWVGVESVGTSIKVSLGGLLGTNEAVHGGIAGATSPVIFGIVWFGRVTFTVSVCFGLIVLGKNSRCHRNRCWCHLWCFSF